MNPASLGTRSCEQIRALLDSYIQNELLVETTHEVLYHLQLCPACASELKIRMQVRSAVRSAVRAEPVPAGLQARVREEIRRHARRYPSIGPYAALTLAAAACLVLLAGGWGIFRSLIPGTGDVSSERLARLLQIGVEDHVVCALQHGMSNRRFTPEQMERALKREYFPLVSLIRDKTPENTEIVVAHRCKVGGREFIHFILRDGGNTRSVVLTRKADESFTRNRLVEVLNATEVPLYSREVGAFQVTGFESREHLAFVVSAGDASSNRELASVLAHPIYEFLAKLEG